MAPQAVAVPARCRPSQGVLPMGVRGDIEFGDAASSSLGLAIGVVRQAPEGDVAAVALLPPDASTLRLVELGPVLRDAPAPRVAWRGVDSGELLAVAPLAPHEGGPPHGLAVCRLRNDGSSTLLQRLDVGDDWASADVAASSQRAIVVWEGSSARSHGPPRGVIRVGTLDAEGRVGETREISPTGEDAEDPRVVGNQSAFFAVWAARRIEEARANAQSASAEVASEPGPRWLEAVVLDDRGVPLGAARRITPATAYLASFDVQLQPVRGAASALVVARMDGASEGGELERLRIRADGTSDAPSQIPTDGLGSGAPALVVGALATAMPWVTWAGLREQVVLLPVDVTGSPAGPPSDEDAFAAALPLVALGGSKVLAAIPAVLPGAAALRVFSCSR